MAKPQMCVVGLEEKLGYTFKAPDLLDQAITHSSYANEHKSEGMRSNERLEFLGDSILGMVVADRLYREHPDMPEGDLTRMRALLVCEGSLAEVARRLDLGAHLKLGHGECVAGGRARPSIMADAVEAILAAVYLDGGIGSARKSIQRLILDHQPEAYANCDYKTALQELVQRKSGQVLRYALVKSSGPDHAKTFRVEVTLNGVPMGTGEGHSKKEAEQSAAKEAIAQLDNDEK
ncbi:MAG: ribonuclease III [Oscillospiraceae bacterium]|nr:ribonuclease III [Oscillospiraceae bacterium]